VTSPRLSAVMELAAAAERDCRWSRSEQPCPGRRCGDTPVDSADARTGPTVEHLERSAPRALLDRASDAASVMIGAIGYSYYTERSRIGWNSSLTPAKSASNLEKHGIDFDAVRAIWQDVMRVEIPARTEDEPR
jgi:hypothetical protein